MTARLLAAATAANALLGSVLILLGAALAAAITFTAVDIAPATWSSLGTSLASALGEDLAALLATFQIDLGTADYRHQLDLMVELLGQGRIADRIMGADQSAVGLQEGYWLWRAGKAEVLGQVLGVVGPCHHHPVHRIDRWKQAHLGQRQRRTGKP